MKVSRCKPDRSRNLTIREANIEDSELLLRWRNDDEVRAASRNTSVIDADSHRKWLETCLHDVNRQLLIAELDSKPVGTVRIDYGRCCELSWTVAPEARKMGIGSRIVADVVRMISVPLRIVARVENAASRKIAERTGFHVVESDEEWVTYQRLVPGTHSSMISIPLNDRRIGPGSPTYVIAELSANHGGSLDVARETIYAIKASGADAVKLQTYTADTLTIDCDRNDFRVGDGTLWAGRTLHDLYQEAHTPWDWQPELFRLACDLGMDCFSTPFDHTAVDFLERLDPPAYKIASFELVDLPLIEYVASMGRPIIMSTGMGSLAEISEAVEIVKAAKVPLALLKCTSAYPSPPELMNLRTIAHMAEAFDVPIGLSDHTLGTAVPIAAVALGACIIEKHFTLSRKSRGPDSSFSLEPNEFRAMVDAIRVAEKAIGQVSYQRTEKEEDSLAFRRSLYVVKDLQAGDLLSEDNVRSIRPGYGLAPKHLKEVIGKRVKCDARRGTPLSWGLVNADE